MTAAERGSAAAQLLIAAVLAMIAATCNGKSCNFVFGNITIDLGHLNTGPATTGDGSMYNYSPCFPDPNVFLKDCAKAFVCKKNKDFTQYTPIGVRKISDIFDHSLWALNLTYEADAEASGCPGGKRYSDVTIYCDKTKKDEFMYEPESTDCKYIFTLKTELACDAARPHSQGLSTGAILLILLLISVAVYLVGGVLYKRLVKGSRGVEQIPNVEFWRSLPGLVVDGCRFVTRPCRGTAQYEQI